MKFSRIALAFLLLVIHSSAAMLIHDYQFQNNLADSLGGPSLVSHGGSVGSNSYTFAAQQGLSLSNGLSNSADYSLYMNFEFDTIAGFRKIVDFKNLGSDDGLYNQSGALVYYPFTSALMTIPAGTFVNVAITRDAASNTVTGYVNGVQQLQFTDSTSDAVFSASNNIIYFFQDDTVTGGNESSSGVTRRIQIFNGALTADQVAALPASGSNVPEPMSLGLAAAGFSLCFLLRSRRNRIVS